MPHDQQAIEQTKRDCRHDKQIHRRDAVGMIMKERLPALRRRASSPGHILGHARLSDIDAELEQLSMDPRRAPQWIGNAHLADQPADLQRHSRSATTSVCDFQRQYDLKPARCQRTMVSGLTIANASQTLGNNR